VGKSNSNFDGKFNPNPENKSVSISEPGCLFTGISDLLLSLHSFADIFLFISSRTSGEFFKKFSIFSGIYSFSGETIKTSLISGFFG